MTNRWIGGILLLWLFTASLVAQADSPVWKVSRDGGHLYLGGTIHVLGKADYPLPEAFGRAYNDADIVILEADVSTLESPAYQQKILREGTYSGDSDITDDLSGETLERLESYLQQRGIPAAPLYRLRPGILSLTLTVIELQRLGFTETGVDEYYETQAMNDGKDLAYLESADDQVRFLLDMGKGQEDELVRHTLAEMEKLPRYMDHLKTAWREGDIGQLEAVGLDTWIDRFPDVYQALLVDRNHNWLPQIERMLETGDTEMVLFGALHLVGDDGILTLLEDRGYELERLN